MPNMATPIQKVAEPAVEVMGDGNFRRLVAVVGIGSAVALAYNALKKHLSTSSSTTSTATSSTAVIGHREGNRSLLSGSHKAGRLASKVSMNLQEASEIYVAGPKSEAVQDLSVHILDFASVRSLNESESKASVRSNATKVEKDQSGRAETKKSKPDVSLPFPVSRSSSVGKPIYRSSTTYSATRYPPSRTGTFIRPKSRLFGDTPNPVTQLVDIHIQNLKNGGRPEDAIFLASSAIPPRQFTPTFARQQAPPNFPQQQMQPSFPQQQTAAPFQQPEQQTDPTYYPEFDSNGNYLAFQPTQEQMSAYAMAASTPTPPTFQSPYYQEMPIQYAQQQPPMFGSREFLYTPPDMHDMQGGNGAARNNASSGRSVTFQDELPTMDNGMGWY